MKYMIFPWIILLFLQVQYSKEFECNIEHVSVIYDKKTTFRIIPPKSNDLIRWSNELNKHFLCRKDLYNDDAFSIFKRLRESIEPDSTIYIPTILNQTVLNVNEGKNEFELAFYEDKEDINADAMIIYYYRNHCANDTLFLTYSSGSNFRLNSFKARGDTTLWRRTVAAILNN